MFAHRYHRIAIEGMGDDAVKLLARWCAGLLAAVLAGLQGCAQLPPLDGRSASTIVEDTADTRLGKAVAPLVQAHPGLSGAVPLADGRDAFAARVRLANLAERTLDVQYYIWHADLSGTLLFEAVRRAADRGVRVRLLLDDNNTDGLDATLAELDAHPNVEVRLFNPFAMRRWRVLGYLTDFARLNRRMHNKSFTADNQVTVIGGRNVGDEYFEAGQDVSFVDLDVMAIGPVVDDVSRDFDRYWASGSSYPAERMLPKVGSEAIGQLQAAANRVERSPAAAAYVEAVAAQPFVRDMLERKLAFEWAVIHMVSDDPAKGLARASDDMLLWSRLKRVMKAPTRELLLVSPYFVPAARGTDYLVGLAKEGVEVSVLTNSLEATDVAAVHAGYAKRRIPLLEGGVHLFEMKRAALSVAPPHPERKSLGSAASSAASLHAKTFAVDRSQLFIGSFNFDPRSARLNTELGFVIDSPVLAEALSNRFRSSVPERAYGVRLTATGRLHWIEQVDGRQVVHDREPGAGFWLHLGVSTLSLLPIEWLL